jgi:bacteriocin biosynthesis cyclodehydratase domain-containing protein
MITTAMTTQRRPRLALPFTVLTAPDTVRLVAGEDFRYTFTAPGLDRWLPDCLARLDGRTPLDEALAGLPEALRGPARQLVDRLYGERVVVDGTASDGHRAARWRLAPEGTAAWAASVAMPQAAGEPLPVLCQDRLDYAEALRFNRRCRQTAAAWLWASTGPMSRAYVSPLFLCDAGPCLSCLLYHFRRLSPAPELYDALASGASIDAVPFPPEASAIVGQLVRWKAALAEADEAPAALYRLHVLELARLEVTSHRVLIDPECPECGRK